MKMDKILISIGRQFGSGGSEIGKLLAQELQIAYYDKEILKVAATESGFSLDLFEKVDEREPAISAFDIPIGFMPSGVCIPCSDVLSSDGLFKLQSDAIRDLAKKESCVIIGRCSDYVLRDEPCMLSIFIHDSIENRISRIMKKLNVNRHKAKDLMVKIDKSRAAYYNYFTDKRWGMADSYNFSVDVSVLGIEGTVRFLKTLAETAILIKN